MIALKTGDSADAAVPRLKGTGRYEYVEPDYIKHAYDITPPNDPNFPSQWGLSNPGNNLNISGPEVPGADIHALAAWAYSPRRFVHRGRHPRYRGPS